MSDEHDCPSPFQFPFELAAAAGLAIDDLDDAQVTVGQTLADAGTTIEGSAFEGVTADMFRLSYQARAEALGWGVLGLSVERSRLDALVTSATAAEGERDTAIVACQATHA